MSLKNESKAEKDRHARIQEKCQTILTQLLRDEDNKYCVDCDAKGPRWASWNIGVFLCIRCAGIHRNLGVHISKVKSVNLDSWTPEQVVSLQQMGNSRARAVYEATLPDTWRRPQTDSSLESFIRAKYQHKRYIAKEWVAPPLPKVDWDKELDEEAEKQKKKKKEKQQAVTTLPPVKKVDVRVPALPKPSSSPKAAHGEDSKSSSVDLLGLNTATQDSSSTNGSEDIFSSFLSAPAASVTTTATVVESVPKIEERKGRSAEEDNFFNQPVSNAPSNNPNQPLSKDSIMALYSSQSVPPTQPTIFHAPGMYPPNQPVGFPPPGNVGLPPGYSFPPVGGFPPVAPVQTLPGFPPPAAAFSNGATPIPAPNPFIGMSLGMMPPPVQGIPVMHVSQTNQLDDLLGDFSSTPEKHLPQQMAGLNLGAPPAGLVQGGFVPGAPFPAMSNVINSAPPPAVGQTFTTHLWQ